VTGGTLPSATPIGQLSDRDWGWIIAAVLFAWISVRAEQATVEGLDVEPLLRATASGLQPWDAGAVVAILPELADLSDVDWSKPLQDWSRDNMVTFLTTALDLVRKALSARDLSGGSISRKPVQTGSTSDRAV
jgi:hypothetical protein